MKEENKNLFETVFDGVEAPKEKEIVLEHEQKDKVEEAQTDFVVEKNEEEIFMENPQMKILNETKTDVFKEKPLESNVQSSKEIYEKEEKMNPLLKLILFILVFVAIVWSLWSIVGMKLVTSFTSSKEEAKKKEVIYHYFDEVEHAYQAKLKEDSSFQDFETCYILSLGKYCSSEEATISDEFSLKITGDFKIDGGTLFLKDGKVSSGNVSMDNAIYKIENGKIKEKQEAVSEEPKEE